jgi:hypothetical protein
VGPYAKTPIEFPDLTLHKRFGLECAVCAILASAIPEQTADTARPPRPIVTVDVAINAVLDDFHESGRCSALSS